jgi:hypothetical protein
MGAGQIISAIFGIQVITIADGKLEHIDLHRKLAWILEKYWALCKLDFAHRRYLQRHGV